MIIKGHKYSPSQLKYLGVSDELIKEYQTELDILQVKRDFNNNTYYNNERRLKNIEKQIYLQIN